MRPPESLRKGGKISQPAVLASQADLGSVGDSAESSRRRYLAGLIAAACGGVRFRRGFVDIASASNDARVRLDAWVSGPVAVHAVAGGRYGISLVESGYRVVDGFCSLEGAKLAAARLRRLGGIEYMGPANVRSPEFETIRNVVAAMKLGDDVDPLAAPEIDGLRYQSVEVMVTSKGGPVA